MAYPEALSFILTRRSIRRFSRRAIPEPDVKILLKAAMAAPSAQNVESWRFLVISGREELNALPRLHPSAGPALDAPLAILVCADLSVKPDDVLWPQDCAAAVQNILLAARMMELGSLWCSIHPQDTLEELFIRHFGLPGTVRPFALVILGWPLQEFFEEDRWKPDNVRLNRWEYRYPL